MVARQPQLPRGGASRTAVASAPSGTQEGGFTVIELMFASMVMLIIMLSVAYVLTGSLGDVAYAKQRDAAVTLANTVVEDLKAQPWATVAAGLSSTDTTLATDQNIQGNCYEGISLDIDGTVPTPTSSCAAVTWHDPACLTGSLSTSFLPAGGVTPTPLSPHEQCTTVNGARFGVDVYPTAPPQTDVASNPPLTITVVVTWAKPVLGGTPVNGQQVANGLQDHVVTTFALSECQVGVAC
ncbi:MAG TPA: hypothetical protein VG184_11825 [Acidimicrobiales bacterium]|jgi:Tfp pilus assembly protein PilV|nr:hypothetical protein [Acidimicrobiales bacterium]